MKHYSRIILSLTLCLAMVLSLAACNSSKVEVETGDKANKITENLKAISAIIDSTNERVLFFINEDKEAGLDKTVKYQSGGKKALSLADEEFKKGNFDKADELYSKVFETDSVQAAQRDPLLFWAWGYSNFKQNKQQDAFYKLQYVGYVFKELEMHQQQVTNTLIEVLDTMKDNKELAGWIFGLRTIISEFNPDNYENLLEMAKLALDYGDIEIFITSFEKIQKNKPELLPASDELAEIYKKAITTVLFLDEDDIETVNDFIDKLMKLDPKDDTAKLAKVISLNKKGQYEQARQILDTINKEENSRTYNLYNELIKKNSGLKPSLVADFNDKNKVSIYSGESKPLWSPDGTKIALISYVREDKNVEKLMIVDVASGRVREVLTSDKIFISGWFSDSNRLLIGADGIKVVDTNSLKITEVTKGNNPILSPDNKKVAYELDGIRVIDLETKEEKRLTSNALDTIHLWDDTSEVVIFSEYIQQTNQLALPTFYITFMDINTLEKDVPIKKPGTYFNVKWIIEGRILSLLDGNYDNHSPFIFRVDMNTVLQLSNGHSYGNDSNGVYWKNGTGMGILTEYGEINLVDVSGNINEAIIIDGYEPYQFPRVYSNFVYSPDNSKIAFLRALPHEYEGSIWLSDDSLTEFTLVTAEKGFYTIPAWSPQGNKLAIIKDEYKLYIYDIK